MPDTPARLVPCIAATFVSNGAVEAVLSFSNNGPHVRKASHFAVYNNAAEDQSLADYPAKFPFTRDVNAGGRTAQVEAAYYQRGVSPKPKLTLTLTNGSTQAVAFTVVANNYSKARTKTYHVPAHGRAQHGVEPLAASNGWYDLSVTIGGDNSWSRRYTGRLEDGTNSVTG
jgi:phospholipase C